MRSQSVAYNTAMATAVGLYYHSDNLIIHQAGKEAEVISHEKLKLNGIRGVAEIPGTTCIAVCGTYFDMAIMDLKTREVLAEFKSSNYDSTHLYHDADI